jgi:hypothetical protein
MKKTLLLAAIAATFALSPAHAAPVRAWISPGTSCETGSKIDYRVGVPIKISVCAQWEGLSCGFGLQLRSDDETYFQIIGRTLHPRFDDPNTFFIPSPTNPLPIVKDARFSDWYFDMGGTSGGGAYPFDHQPLITLDIIATARAAGSRYQITTGDYAQLAISKIDPQYPNWPCALPDDADFRTTPLTLDNLDAPPAWLPK